MNDPIPPEAAAWLAGFRQGLHEAPPTRPQENRMNQLPEILRRLHDLATAGRVADYRHLLAAADELERLRAANEALREEVVRLERAVLAGGR